MRCNFCYSFFCFPMKHVTLLGRTVDTHTHGDDETILQVKESLRNITQFYELKFTVSY